MKMKLENISRRDFLMKTSIGTAGLAVSQTNPSFSQPVEAENQLPKVPMRSIIGLHTDAG